MLCVTPSIDSKEIYKQLQKEKITIHKFFPFTYAFFTRIDEFIEKGEEIEILTYLCVDEEALYRRPIYGQHVPNLNELLATEGIAKVVQYLVKELTTYYGIDIIYCQEKERIYLTQTTKNISIILEYIKQLQKTLGNSYNVRVYTSLNKYVHTGIIEKFLLSEQ